MSNVVIMREDDRPVPLNAGGFMITVLASREDSSGYEIFHQSGPEGKGPGPHFHPWDEAFYVLAGELHCGVDGVETVAGVGTLIHVPGGSTHWFRFGAGGGAVLAITSRGNASPMFTEYDRGVDWESGDREQLIEVAARHGQTIIR